MPVSLLVCVIATVGAGLSALGVLAWRRLSEYGVTRHRGDPDEERSLEMYQPVRYQPMARLLGGEDLDFLHSHARCPKVAARWQRSQRRIVRLYLKELAGDFHYLHTKARTMVAEAPEQYAALVPVLFKQQFAFWRALIVIELRLSLGGLNLTPASLQNLTEAISSMQREISRVAATA
jgi:hypothetical protein